MHSYFAETFLHHTKVHEYVKSVKWFSINFYISVHES